MSKHTPGPWRFEPGGGHASNRIVGVEAVQVSGWRERRGGASNASHSERVCENLGDMDLDAPYANACLIAAAPDLLAVLKDAHPHIHDDALRIRIGTVIAQAEGL